MWKPKLSVITTVYNCYDYLHESLESLLSQTFKDFEVIIVNDGSEDSTAAIAKLFVEKTNKAAYELKFPSDTFCTFIDNSDNKKIPTRRNEAIAQARGEYIAIHDGDDISYPWRFEKQIDRLEKGDLFCLGGHAVKIDLKGKEFGLMDYPPGNHMNIEYHFTQKCMNVMIDPTTIFRKDVFDELGGYSLEKEIYTVPDFDLWTKAMLGGQIFANLKCPLIKYRENPKGMTGSHKKEMIQQHMIVWKRFMAVYHVNKRLKLQRKV